MQISKRPSEVRITFSPEDYCLVVCKNIEKGEYTLNFLIDRSEKGKMPDVGIEVMYLNEKQASIFKDAGFIEYKYE